MGVRTRFTTHSQHFKILSGTIIANKTYQASSFLRDPFFPACSHLFKSPNQILHQPVRCFLSSIHPRRQRYSMRISHIAYLRQHITMSGLQGISHSQQIQLLFLRLTGSDRAARSKFASRKSVHFHSVDLNAKPFTSALRRNWGP